MLSYGTSDGFESSGSSSLFSTLSSTTNNTNNNLFSAAAAAASGRNNGAASPVPFSERTTSRLFDYTTNSSPSRGDTAELDAGKSDAEGEVAKLDHDHVIYGALLEECTDNRYCTGVLSGCYKAHAWNSWQIVRRDPRKFNYGSKLCSFFAEGSCQKGDQCSFAHSKTEVQFHPKVYKTQACNRFTGSRYCGNKLCAFYHIFDDGSDDSRKPFPEDNSGSGSPTGSFTMDENVWLDRAAIFKAASTPKLNNVSELSMSANSTPRFGSASPGLARGFNSIVSPPTMNLDSLQSTWKAPARRSLERSCSEMRTTDKRFQEPTWDPLKRVSSYRGSVSTGDVDFVAFESASSHWSLEHLDSKMKNPNRKESQFGLNLLAWVPDFPLRELIKTLHDESWSVEQLRSYLSHTLVRALEERKVIVSESGKFAGFNTGLVPPNTSHCMVAVLTYSPVQQGTKFEWTLTHFKSPSEIVSSKFLSTVPSPVCYMDNKSDMWFDPNKRILSFGESLLARVIDRIAEARPEVVDYDVFIQMAILEKAMKNAETNVLQNPNVAVPSFYRPKGQLYGSVQFLLPISFSDDTSRVDGALAVQERVTGYVACTVLSLQDAYAHARLIGKPTADWLNAAVGNTTGGDASMKRSSEEKIFLDKVGSVQFFYHENSVPRIVAIPIEDKLGEKEFHEDVGQFVKRAGAAQYSVRRVDVSGKTVWELYLNHTDYMHMLKNYGRMSSLEVYHKNFFTVN